MKSLKSLIWTAALALVASPLWAMPEGTPAGQTNRSHPATSSQTQTQNQDNEQNEKPEHRHRRHRRRHHRKHRRHHHSKPASLQGLGTTSAGTTRI